MIYLNVLLIAVVITFGLDVAGFWNEATSIISGWLTKGVVKKPFVMKPFSCSLCMTFWTSLIYVLVVHALTLPMLTCICLCAWLTTVIPGIFYLIEGAITKFLSDMGNWMKLE